MDVTILKAMIDDLTRSGQSGRPLIRKIEIENELDRLLITSDLTDDVVATYTKPDMVLTDLLDPDIGDVVEKNGAFEASKNSDFLSIYQNYIDKLKTVNDG